MDPALKQRMLGAVVLIALLVIFAPMLLHSEKPVSQTESVDLSIPTPPQRDFETRVVPLTAPTGEGDHLQQAAPDPNQVTTVVTDSVDRGDALAEPNPQTTIPESTPPASPPLATATVNPVQATAAAPAEASPLARGRYAVNLGTYAKAENANALVAELKKSGLTAYAEKADWNGQPALRVRAGPFADRTEAEKFRLLAQQARAGLQANVIEVADAPTRDIGAVEVGSRAVGWSVQVAAYAAQAEANALRDRLVQGKLPAYVETLRTEQGALYRVRVGPEMQRDQAESLRAQLKAWYRLDGNIVPHP